MPYLIDTNVLITARRLHYGFDFCPGFWEWVIEQHRAGAVFSIEQVKREIQVGNDELTNWANDLPKSFWLKQGRDCDPALQTISQWLEQTQASQAQKNQFYAGADFLLIAHAMQFQFTVVTYESVEKTKGKVQIPTVCRQMNVACIAPHTLLRQQGAFFRQSERP